MSHELRTPLNAIRVSVAYCKRRRKFHPKTKCLEYLKHITTVVTTFIRGQFILDDLIKLKAGMMTLDLAATEFAARLFNKTVC